MIWIPTTDHITYMGRVLARHSELGKQENSAKKCLYIWVIAGLLSSKALLLLLRWVEASSNYVFQKSEWTKLLHFFFGI